MDKLIGLHWHNNGLRLKIMIQQLHLSKSKMVLNMSSHPERKRLQFKEGAEKPPWIYATLKGTKNILVGREYPGTRIGKAQTYGQMA